MKILTADGVFLSGDPVEIVQRLGQRVAVGVNRRSRQERLYEEECERIDRYVHQIGREFALMAARHLLQSLEDDGYLLIYRAS